MAYITGTIRTNNPELLGTVGFFHTGGVLATIVDAIDSVILGMRNEFYDETITHTTVAGATTTAAPVTAQQGNVWRVSYKTTAGKFNFSIPTADSSKLTAGSDLLPATPLGVLKTALDAKIADKFGNAGTIYKVKYGNEKRGN